MDAAPTTTSARIALGVWACGAVAGAAVAAGIAGTFGGGSSLDGGALASVVIWFVGLLAGLAVLALAALVGSMFALMAFKEGGEPIVDISPSGEYVHRRAGRSPATWAALILNLGTLLALGIAWFVMERHAAGQ